MLHFSINYGEYTTPTLFSIKKKKKKIRFKQTNNSNNISNTDN